MSKRIRCNGRHAKLAPSAGHRWTHCTASVAFIEKLKLPASESPYAEEGTLAHETLYAALGLRNPFKVNWGSNEEKEYLPYTIEYVLHILSIYPDAKLYREVSVNPQYFVKTRHCKGTADIVIAVPCGPIYVIDLKFGEHVSVDVIDNVHLLLYGLGALARFEIEEGMVFTEVVLVISQPRAYHPDGINREWRLKVNEIIEYADWLGRRAREALNPEKAVFRPEPETVCRFCPAQGVCRALAQYTLKEVREVFNDIIAEEIEYKDIAQLTVEEISHLIDEFPGIRRWMSNVSATAVDLLEKGARIPYYDLKAKLSNRQWSADETELLDHFGEEIYEQSLISPAQAEKRFGKGSVDDFVERVQTGFTLVRTTDPTASDEPMPFGVIPDAENTSKPKRK